MIWYYTVHIYHSNYINILKRLQQKCKILQCMSLFNDFSPREKWNALFEFKANILSHCRSYVQLKHNIFIWYWSFFCKNVRSKWISSFIEILDRKDSKTAINMIIMCFYRRIKSNRSRLRFMVQLGIILILSHEHSLPFPLISHRTIS